MSEMPACLGRKASRACLILPEKHLTLWEQTLSFGRVSPSPSDDDDCRHLSSYQDEKRQGADDFFHCRASSPANTFVDKGLFSDPKATRAGLTWPEGQLKFFSRRRQSRKLRDHRETRAA